MSNKYLITVTGTQEIGGEEETIEVITTGSYKEKDNIKIIEYNEYEDENTDKYTKTKIEIEGNKITITRTNIYTSILLLEKNERHQCHYQTEFGSVIMGVYTKDFTENLTKEGGDLYVDYQIDFFSSYITNNKFHVNIKEN